ncbi:MAG: PqiC family protein [Betaproteobacteria bacterium]|nr:PqiC family protein [Betaproteobacteria bacterium]
MSFCLRLFLPLLLLSACSIRHDRAVIDGFDLGAGTAEVQAMDDSRRAWRFEVRSGSDLVDEGMRYRLEYHKPAGGAQVLTYSRSRWVSPPAEILRRHLKHYLFWPNDAEDRCYLVLNLTRFEQIFSAPEQSSGVIALEAQVWNSETGRLEDEARFFRAVTALSPDAAGGVAALAEGATRLAVDNLLPWREMGKKDRQRACWQSVQKG